MGPRPPGDSAPAGRLGGERRPSASPPRAAAVLSSRRRPAGLSGRARGPSVSAHARGQGSGSRFASLPPGPCASPCLRVYTPGTRGTLCSQTTPDAVVAVRRRGKPPPTSCLVFPVKRATLSPDPVPPAAPCPRFASATALFSQSCLFKSSGFHLPRPSKGFEQVFAPQTSFITSCRARCPFAVATFGEGRPLLPPGDALFTSG